MKQMENVTVLLNLAQHPLSLFDGVELRQSVRDREAISIHPEQQDRVEKRVEEILKDNPRFYAGPTVRYIGFELAKNDGLLRVESLPSDYAEGSIGGLGWLGVAMVPVTSDGKIALQGPLRSTSATLGGGIRVPGCTPNRWDDKTREELEIMTTGQFIYEILKDMGEEFGGVAYSPQTDIAVVGLMQVRPPAYWESAYNPDGKPLKPHCALILRINVREDETQFRECWQNAKDRDKEGPLLFLKLTEEKVREAVDDIEGYNQQSRRIIGMIAENVLGINFD